MSNWAERIRNEVGTAVIGQEIVIERMLVALNRNAGVGRGEWAFGGIGHGKNPSRLRTLPEPALPMDVPRRIVVRK